MRGVEIFSANATHGMIAPQLRGAAVAVDPIRRGARSRPHAAETVWRTRLYGSPFMRPAVVLDALGDKIESLTLRTAACSVPTFERCEIHIGHHTCSNAIGIMHDQ